MDTELYRLYEERKIASQSSAGPTIVMLFGALLCFTVVGAIVGVPMMYMAYKAQQEQAARLKEIDRAIARHSGLKFAG